MVKCACADCVCIVGTDAAIQAEGRMFCSDSCANHHEDSAGCEHGGCPCHG
nr:metallothionein [Erythrobacter litoralis]